MRKLNEEVFYAIAVFAPYKTNDGDIGRHHRFGGSGVRRRRGYANQRAYGYESGAYGHNACDG